MRERLPVARNLVDHYFDIEYALADPARFEHHADLAQQLSDNANPSFRGADHEHYVHVLVAAASETYLTETLETLGSQLTDAPDTAAVFSVNAPQSPTAKGVQRIQSNLEVITNYIDEHPELPISYFQTVYPPRTPIGEINADAHAAIIHLLHERYGRNVMPDVLMTRWDADTLRATDGYIADTRQTYARSNALAFRTYPLLRHDRLDETRFPMTNQLLAWYDSVQHVGQSVAPAHYSVNLGAICLAGGMPHYASGEQQYLWLSAQRNLDQLGRGGTMESLPLRHKAAVSSRRLVGRLATGRLTHYDELVLASSEQRPHATLHSDVSEDLFNNDLEKTIGLLYESAYNRSVYEQRKQRVSAEDAVRPAAHYAERYLRAGMWLFGDSGNTRDIIDNEIAYRRDNLQI
jgi:hypothetical protein